MAVEPGPARPRMNQRTWIALAAGAAVVLFLLGFIPQAVKGRRVRQEAVQQSARITELESELARTRVLRDLALSHTRLGLVLYEVNRNNFASAQARSTQFFDSLRDAMSAPAFASAVPQAQTFRSMLQRRDEISADLARADQAARQKLTEMYLQFEQALPR